MDRVVLSTLVYRAPEEVFPYVESFERYPRYTEHLAWVREDGAGRDGPRYDLHLSWWKIEYTAKSEVVDVEPPERIEWRLVKDVDAWGVWRVESAPDATPPDEPAASRLVFEANYDPHTANEDAVSLPRFVSVGWVVRRLRPILLGEARAVVEELVADIEGRPRPVELTVHEAP